MTYITEIIPDSWPDWAKDAFDDGQFFRIAVEKVIDLEAQLSKEWISVEDRLPEKGVKVLIGRDDNVGHAKFNGHSWTIISSNDVVVPSQVTHWQPLPKAPK